MFLAVEDILCLDLSANRAEAKQLTFRKRVRTQYVREALRTPDELAIVTALFVEGLMCVPVGGLAAFISKAES